MADSKRLTSLLQDYLKRAIAGTLPAGTLTVGSPNKLGHGQKIISATNTPEKLSDTITNAITVWLQTPKTNSDVYIGGSGVNTHSCKIKRDSNGFLDISDLTVVYVYGNAGDIINFDYTYNG